MNENNLRDKLKKQLGFPLLPQFYRFVYVEECDGVILADNNGIPLTAKEHLNLIELLSNTAIKFDNFEKAMDEIIDIKTNETYNLPVRDLTKKEKRKSPGYVYFVQCNNVVKIGMAKDLNNRVKVYGVNSPFKTKLLHYIKTENKKELEAFFHETFSNKRTDGEWFELTKQDIKDIKDGIYEKLYECG